MASSIAVPDAVSSTRTGNSGSSKMLAPRTTTAHKIRGRFGAICLNVRTPTRVHFDRSTQHHNTCLLLLLASISVCDILAILTRTGSERSAFMMLYVDGHLILTAWPLLITSSAPSHLPHGIPRAMGWLRPHLRPRMFSITPKAPSIPFKLVKVSVRPSSSGGHSCSLFLGTYVLRDDLQLATPPPHPSEAPVANPNPLATGAAPPVSGVKLTLVSLNPKQVRPDIYKSATTSSSLLRWKSLGLKDTREWKEAEKEQRTSTDSSSDTSHAAGSANGSNKSNVPAFGKGNAALSPVTGKDGLKRRKPRNNIIKSNSSFVSRVIPHDVLAKKLAERDPGGTFAFANINRAFQWLDLSSSSKTDPMTKILFTKAHILCHDVNSLTKHASHIDVVMGSSASDIIWYEPMSQKYARINKNGIINSTPVSKIKWIPGSENHFLAAHTDGTLIVYDKEKEDAPFVSEELVDEAISIDDDDDQSTLHITKSVNSANQKANPVACWKLSNQSINDFAFSPDNRHLAVVGEDGYLRIIDYLQERYMLRPA